MKTFTRPDGSTVEYDPDRDCWRCGFPVGAVSIIELPVCKWCDASLCRFCGERIDTKGPEIRMHLVAKHREEVWAVAKEA